MTSAGVGGEQLSKCDCRSVEELVANHRTDLIKLALHGDRFIRVLALAALISADGPESVGSVQRDLQLVQEVLADR
jgi:hypothetical protein